MKKVFLIVLVVALVLLLTACGSSYRPFGYEYSFTRAYINVGDTWIDVEIYEWTDVGSGQVQLTLKDGTVLLVGAHNWILYDGTLPETCSSSCTDWDHRVLVDVCKELDVSPEGMVIEFIYKEYVAWLACETYTYRVTLPDGRVYYAGARENEDGFYCDVWED